MTRSEELAARRERMIDFIRDYLTEHGYHPTVQEIADSVPLGLSACHGALVALTEEGRLRKVQVTRGRVVYTLPEVVSL